MHDAHFPHLLATLVAIIIATKLLGELARRIGQPAVLGELIGGVLLGGSLLGLVDPADPVIRSMAELGVLILLFEIGLHTDLRSLARVGRSALAVAVVGVMLPFVLGYGASHLLGLGVLAALFCAASLTATSIGISARVLSDLGQLERPEGQIVLGAAVLDDVIGLIILSVVSLLAGGAAVTAGGIAIKTGAALGFIAVALLAGSLLVPPIFRIVEQIKVAGALGLIAVAFAFMLAWIAEHLGSAMIIGAFAAGLVLHRTPQRGEIERATTQIGYFFVPIFFAVVGAAVDLQALARLDALMIGGALTVIAVVGKFAAGYAPLTFRGNKAMIGVAMIPRGEVGLIFAQMGLRTGALDARLFSAITLMVVMTTFLAPILLGRMVRTGRVPGEPGAEGGLEELVGGRPAGD